MVGSKFRGNDDARGLRFAIVVSRFNEGIATKLLEAAERTFAERGAADVDVAWVPGAFEIPLLARRLAETSMYDAVLCLGCVIKGETAHFEYVAGEAARGIARAGYETGVPVIYQVLAVYRPDQAAARVTDGLNRGREGALAAIEMARLIENLPGPQRARSKHRQRVRR
jgi:6,7-dimethyl-8-ribityllumazine synthase